MRVIFWVVAVSGCGGGWQEADLQEVHGAFPMDCSHASAGCDSCHVQEGPLVAVDPTCLRCHEAERPASHDPATTATCEECHSGACGWDSASPHPAGFAEPDAHGVAFNVADPTEGDCMECHGADLRGGEASGCDDCHTQEGAADWREDCTFCHGGTETATGAPPVDMDGLDTDLSFLAHTPHVDDDGDYRALPCSDCHAVVTDVLDPGHVLDGSPGVAEMDFSGGPSSQAIWSGTSCTNTYCHGAGQRHEAVVADGNTTMQCGSCHSTQSAWDTMSGLHEIHLDDGSGIVCQECHADTIDAAGNIVAPELHVNGTRDVAFTETTITTIDGGGNCEGACHGYPHDGTGWGHEPGYEEPEVHGTDALTGWSDCTSCHGSDLQGGTSNQGCDECHEDNWRTDCTYCHGGAGGDTDGLPPQDLDNTTSEAAISFNAHPEHGDNDEHPQYECSVCHGANASNYVDALLDVGHWFDGTEGTAEVSFTGIAAGASYNNGTCSNLYCHGNGINDGSETDSGTALGCGDCHSDPPRGTAEHRDHNHDRVGCNWCHDSVAASSSTIDGPNRHVDGTNQIAFSSDANQWGGMSYNAGNNSCSGRCHAGGDDENHNNERWD